MKEFHIFLHSFRQVKEFVALATVQPFDVLVGNDKHQINGKGFIGMSSLDYSRPLRVCVRCSEEEFRRFQIDAANFIA